MSGETGRRDGDRSGTAGSDVTTEGAGLKAVEEVMAQLAVQRAPFGFYLRFYLSRMSAYVILLQVLHLKMFKLLLINV